MLNFSKFTKEDALAEEKPFDVAALVKAEAGAAERHSDGKFKLGPVNAQHKNGDQAFEMAHGHIDEAQKSARIGDAHAAAFHIGMAQQYANAGCQNHMMGDYLKQTGGKPVMMPPPDMGNGKPQK